MRLTDADALFALKSNSDVTSRYGQEPHRTVDQTSKWVKERLDLYQKRDAIFWVPALKGDNQNRAIGEICYWNFDPTFTCAEIGYELHPAYWNKGIMREALLEILGFGFNIGLNRIEANPLATNESSTKLLIKLGFKHEGTLRERVFFRGEFIDQLYFVLLKKEWKEKINTA
jgi:ribosomal-protein-alanine N-acetyltransferase